MDTRSGDTFEVPMDPKAQPMQAATAAKVGFRELTREESDAVKRCREVGSQIEKLLEELETFVPKSDPRWRAIAKTHFQEGLQAAVRSITRPAFF